MENKDCSYCHGTCGCHKEGHKLPKGLIMSFIMSCTCPFNGPIIKFKKDKIKYIEVRLLKKFKDKIESSLINEKEIA